MRRITMINVEDFFDPYNVEHLKAYEHLERTGTWPEGFIPHDVKMTPFWQITIACKLATAFVKAAKKGCIPGMPEFD
jgi:hypothetical protein